MLACLIGMGGATAAQARLQPTPPPSGIVVHLFGPDSVLQGVAPALASAPGSTHPGAAPGGATPAEPSWGYVLHQMFVTGDPDSSNQPAPGKIGHQLSN